ncbi:hypothetical protein [Brevibacillus centrosporus]|uniref:hypothetical protein n=1 Tax=Brevibacillus centrosporus TaxID=54910 RepID=UPI002E1FC378|nr:hypothetical protein [Brevibacillus centrosporus]MED4909331.1 hypothetical protein [Brevibacillus centrosporus]
MNDRQGAGELEELIMQRQAEFPEIGTSLNPLEEPWWGFDLYADNSTGISSDSES